MDSPFDENAKSRTLYIGNLDPSVSENLLMALFTQIGPCGNCKIIREPTSDPYAFIEFNEHEAAAHALLAMNKRLFMGKEIKVNWAPTSTSATKITDTTKQYHIYVGDLSPEIDENALHEAFSPFGEISEIKIIKFPDTQRPKGYCFIAFTNQNDAETAIISMNGRWLGTQRIHTNWSERKAPTNEFTSKTQYPKRFTTRHEQESSPAKLDYNEVWNRTGDKNRTVYVGDCANVNEDSIRSKFAPFGHIHEIHMVKNKNFAFVRFATKESACKAICHLHATKIQGRTISCSWARDDSINDRNNITNYGNGNMNNQKNNNNNNQYHSYSQNSYGPSSNNNYKVKGDDGSDYGNYDNSYQQQYHNFQQWNNNNINDPEPNSMWALYSQSAADNGGWNHNNNNYYYEPNFNQYNNLQ